jgi:phosphoserine aminotransferase
MLDEQVRWILDNGGLAWAGAKTAATSAALYAWAEATAYTTPFVTNPADRSPVVVTIDFDESVDAAAIAKSLRENGIVDTEPYRKLGRNQLRIATFVSIDEDDVRRLIGAIEYTAERL